MKGEETTIVRIDAWLWAARFFKTRALAKQAVERGRVLLDGAACKPSHAVKIGDALRVRRGEEIFEIEVAGLAHKRGRARTSSRGARRLHAAAEAARQARTQVAARAQRYRRRLINVLTEVS